MALKAGTTTVAIGKDIVVVVPKGTVITDFSSTSSSGASPVAVYVDASLMDVDNAYCIDNHGGGYSFVAPADGIVVMTGNGHYINGVTNTDLQISTSTSYGGAMEVFAGDNVRVITTGGERGGFFIPYK